MNLKIVILGPDGAGKSSVISGLMSRLKSEKLTIKMRHLKPRTVANLRGKPDVIVVDPHGMPPRGAFLSIVKIVVWLMEEWCFTLFQEKHKTVLICDRYYHDLLVDPMRYRFGAPTWTAKAIGYLMPRPKLWMLLHAPANILQSRKQEVAHEETARQVEAYLTFIRKQKRHVIVDASQPLDKVIADAERAVNQFLRKQEGNRG